MHAYPAGGPTGHNDVFAAMCEKHRARLVAYCKRRLGTAHDAEDAAHEALVRAYRAMPGFDPSTDAWPWLRTIAAHVCTDMLRRAARAPSPGLLDAHAPDDVHEQVVSRLRADILDDAMGRLSPSYRSALLLREFAGWSYDEIARVQGKSLSSVRSILTRGRRRLGAHVESVARSRGQWPLPGAMPPLRRLREHVRSVRHLFERSGQAVATAFELSSVAAGWAVNANATFTSALTFSAAAVAVLVPAVPAAGAAAPNAPSAFAAVEVGRPENTGVGLSAVPGGVQATANLSPPPPETFTRFDTSAPLGDTPAHDFGSDSTVGVTGNDEHLWVRYRTTVSVPGMGEYPLGVSTNIPCRAIPGTEPMCPLVRPVLRDLPDP